MYNISYMLTFLGCFLAAILSAQSEKTQTIRGIVLDKDSKLPLSFANILISTTDPAMGSNTEEDGTFRIENVPVGRHSLTCSYLGYSDYNSENIIVSSGKELFLSIELTEEAFKGVEIVVVDSTAKQHRTLNDMTLVSGRSFSVEETQRYAGSINDPSRMAMGFAGVQANRDNNSDIVVRGNSPIGVLWRLEGVDIPNPNHFARRGSTGGGITVFSASLLANSDFSTGAFAPEYGNAFASVFDLRFRKGNNEKREYTFRAGLIGLDFATEGYFKKGSSSYLVNYRYSTLGILNQLGFRLVGPRVDNTFQDLSFNLNFPSKDKKQTISLFGIGGVSKEFTEVEKDTAKWIQYTDYLRTDFSSAMFATGVSHTITLDNKSYLKTTLALMANQVDFNDDTLTLQMAATRVSTEKYIDGRATLASFYNRKINAQYTLKAGVFINHIFFNYKNYRLNRNTFATDTLTDGNGSTQLLQAYVQNKYKISPRLTTVFGLHAMLLTLNGSNAIDPRVSFQYNLGKGQTLSLGYGLHSRTLGIGSYFTSIPQVMTRELVNRNLGMIKAHHLVLGYDWYGKKGWHVRAEAYYQSLFNVPVGVSMDSSYWILNDRDGFAKEKMSNDGTGLNYGLDLTVEKFFGNNFFVLVSGAYYRSFYKGLDGVQRSTRYDGIYNSSYMGGKEFAFKNGGVLQLGVRGVLSGGLRYTPADSIASAAARAYVPDLNKIYAVQTPFYARLDLRIAYRKNMRRSNYTLALDVQNATARKNVREETFDYVTQKIAFTYQSGLVPVLSFQIDF